RAGRRRDPRVAAQAPGKAATIGEVDPDAGMLGEKGSHLCGWSEVPTEATDKGLRVPASTAHDRQPTHRDSPHRQLAGNSLEMDEPARLFSETDRLGCGKGEGGGPSRRPRPHQEPRCRCWLQRGAMPVGAPEPEEVARRPWYAASAAKPANR